LDMSRIHPECPDSDPTDWSLDADIFLRQEPEEEEDEDEQEDDGDDGDVGKEERMMTTKTKATRSQPAFIYSMGER
jgi:hypothetical protein